MTPLDTRRSASLETDTRSAVPGQTRVASVPHTGVRTRAAVGLVTVATILAVASPTLAQYPQPPSGPCTQSTMQFTAQYQLDPAYAGSYHTVLTNWKWITTSVALAGLTVAPDPSFKSQWWWDPDVPMTVTMTGTTISVPMKLKKWYIWGYTNMAFAPDPITVKLTDGSTTHWLNVYWAKAFGQYPEKINTNYTKKWNLCYSLSTMYTMADPGDPSVMPIWTHLIAQLDELIVSDTYDGPIEQRSAALASDLEALGASNDELLLIVQQAELPEGEWLRWELLDRLERIGARLAGSREEVELAHSMESSDEAAALYSSARARIEEVEALTTERDELLAQITAE